MCGMVAPHVPINAHAQETNYTLQSMNGSFRSPPNRQIEIILL